ncbi:MAG: hypothetical protein GX175_11175 [Halanaerobiaceae bacterium]|nr:hypothetical protein [Halanaerobiaceae bacterium]
MDKKEFSNFLINASNQANLTTVNDLSAVQINSVFIFVDPYRLKNFSIEELPDLEIQMNDGQSIRLNNQDFELIEISPGISVFGVLAHE